MMKKLCAILLAACLLPAVLCAQNPRAVIKAIYKGDSFEQVKDKHDRAVKSNPGNEPAMQLMEALYLLHNGQPVDGYYQYCGSRAEIESSNDIAKMLKSLQLRLPDLFAALESASTSEILRLDDEEQFDKYIDVASANGNHSLDILMAARENRAFSDAEKANTVEAYTRFLTKYPDAKDYNRERAVALRTNLHYKAAAGSGDEEAMEKFLADYPDYSRNAELSALLADLRYARVMKDANKADLWWFANKYPDYKDIAKVLGTISEIEYGELDTTDLAAVKKYVESWPDSRHSAGLKKMLQFEQMIRKADLAAIFAYIEANGYTADYPRMVRAIARVHDAFILTPDIREVDLVRFRDSKGNVGYWSKNGAVAIAPHYDTFPVSEGIFPYDAVYGPEFVKGRGIAAVLQGSVAGVISRQGSSVVNSKGSGVTISDVSSIILPSGGRDTLKTELYTLTGSYLGVGSYVQSAVPCAERGRFNPGAVAGGMTGRLNAFANVSLGPVDSLSILTLDGIALGLKAVVKNGRIRAFNDHVVATDKGIVLVDNWSILGRDDFDGNEFVKEGRILVCRSGKWGYLDGSMNQAIEPAYTYAESFCGGSALVGNGSSFSLIDAGGTEIFSAPIMRRIPFCDERRSEFEHYAFYVYRDGDVCGVVDSGAAVILPPVEMDVDASGVPAVRISASGDLVFLKNGRPHRLDLTELVSNTAK